MLWGKEDFFVGCCGGLGLFERLKFVVYVTVAYISAACSACNKVMETDSLLSSFWAEMNTKSCLGTQCFTRILGDEDSIVSLHATSSKVSILTKAGTENGCDYFELNLTEATLKQHFDEATMNSDKSGALLAKDFAGAISNTYPYSPEVVVEPVEESYCCKLWVVYSMGSINLRAPLTLNVVQRGLASCIFERDYDWIAQKNTDIEKFHSENNDKLKKLANLVKNQVSKEVQTQVDTFMRDMQAPGRRKLPPGIHSSNNFSGRSSSSSSSRSSSSSSSSGSSSSGNSNSSSSATGKIQVQWTATEATPSNLVQELYLRSEVSPSELSLAESQSQAQAQSQSHSHSHSHSQTQPLSQPHNNKKRKNNAGAGGGVGIFRR